MDRDDKLFWDLSDGVTPDERAVIVATDDQMFADLTDYLKLRPNFFFAGFTAADDDAGTFENFRVSSNIEGSGHAYFNFYAELIGGAIEQLAYAFGKRRGEIAMILFQQVLPMMIVKDVEDEEPPDAS